MSRGLYVLVSSVADWIVYVGLALIVFFTFLALFGCTQELTCPVYMCESGDRFQEVDQTGWQKPGYVSPAEVCIEFFNSTIRDVVFERCWE